MVEFIAAVFSLGCFGLLVQRTVLGALLSLQVMTVAVLLALEVLAGSGPLRSLEYSSSIVGRARDAGLVFMVVFQIQTVAALAFIARLHYLRRSSGMADLTKLRN